MCHWAPSRSRNLSAVLANSCTRFSPKRRNPAAYASRMRSGGCVLVTAMSAISIGLRPARRAVAAMRSRTRATFSAIDIDSLNHRGHGVTQEVPGVLLLLGIHAGEDTRATDSHPTHFVLHDRCRWCWFAGVACGRERQPDHQNSQEEHHDHSAEKIRRLTKNLRSGPLGRELQASPYQSEHGLAGNQTGGGEQSRVIHTCHLRFVESAALG